MPGAHGEDDNMSNELDWTKAEAHLKSTKKSYADLISMPNVNPYFGLGIIAAAESRFELGERTQALYNEIMGLE